MEADKGRVLVVDDEENIRLILNNILSGRGFDVRLAADGTEGLLCLDREVVDFILCDVRMPVMDGNRFLAEVRARGIRAPVIMLSAYGSVDSALEAIKNGAFDYVFKPFKPDDILLALKKAESRRRLAQTTPAGPDRASGAPTTDLVARSRAMLDLMGMIDRVAQVKSPVLIQGESGTGKELVARAIHERGTRREGPFVPVNCGAIVEALLESELFGHVKGAFTDAKSDRAGLFREAHGGTLFLDEVAELPPGFQVKLLRAIQFEEVRPVGAAGPVSVDVRVVAAGAADLPAAVKAGRFREDLYYRLNVLPLFLPPLRERPEDVPPLLDHFLNLFSARLGRPRPEVAPEAVEALVRYHWPGNVRELENLVDRLLVLSPGDRVELDDLPPHLGGEAPSQWMESEASAEDLDLKDGIRRLEARMIAEALEASGGNRSEAARRLKISYPSLLAKIKKYGLDEA